MKKCLAIALIISALAYPVYAWYNIGAVGGKVASAPAGPTCSGDFSSGQNESFEKADGEFCTTDWSETDAGSAINTYSTGWNFCGTHSVSVIFDSDSPNNYIRADLGSADADFYLRYYFKYAALPNYYSAQYQPRIGNDSGMGFYVNVGNNTDQSRHELVMRNNDGTWSTEYFAVVNNGEYRVELHVVGSSGTTTMELYEKNGASWDHKLSSSGGSDYEINITSSQTNHRYIDWLSSGTSSTPTTLYYDDVKVAISGAGYIGADTCE